MPNRIPSQKHRSQKSHPNPQRFALEWTDGKVYIGGVSGAHDTTIFIFEYAISDSLQKEYSQELIVKGGTPPLSFSNRIVCPDFTFYINKSFANSSFVDRKNNLIPTVVGEVACGETTEHLIERCQAYINDFGVDIAIGVDILYPYEEEKDSFNLPNYVNLYIFYPDQVNPLPIQIPLDQLFTFRLRSEFLERKIATNYQSNMKCQNGFIEVTVLLKRRNIYGDILLNKKQNKSRRVS